MAILEVDGLKVYFHTRNGVVKAVDDVSFSVDSGETLAIVGESGSGKSVTCYSLLDLLPKPPAKIEGGTALFNGKDLEGWWGIGTEDPAKWMALSPEKLAEKKAKSLVDISKHWSVEGDELVNDGKGRVHRVTKGNYLGRNFGEITGINGLEIEILETVPDGKGGWINRPRTLAINQD